MEGGAGEPLTARGRCNHPDWAVCKCAMEPRWCNIQAAMCIGLKDVADCVRHAITPPPVASRTTPVSHLHPVFCPCVILCPQLGEWRGCREALLSTYLTWMGQLIDFRESTQHAQRLQLVHDMQVHTSRAPRRLYPFLSSLPVCVCSQAVSFPFSFHLAWCERYMCLSSVTPESVWSFLSAPSLTLCG